MSKMSKNLVAITLSVATVLPNTSMVSSASGLSDKCYDKYINKLDSNTRYVYKDKNVCGWNDCMIDVLTYDKIPEYIDRMEKKFDEIYNEKNILKNSEKLYQIYANLKTLGKLIDKKIFKNKNIVLASGERISDLLIFDTSKKIKYDQEYGDEYFKEIKEKLEPINKKIEEKYNLKRKAPSDDWSNDVSEVMMGSSLVGVVAAAIIGGIIGIYFMVTKVPNIENNPIAKDIINKYNSLPEAMKLNVKKKFSSCRCFGKKVELNEENLNKLDEKELKELLEYIKSLETLKNE